MKRTIAMTVAVCMAALVGCAIVNIADYVGGPTGAMLEATGEPWMDFTEGDLRYIVYRSSLNALGVTPAGCDSVVLVRESVVTELRQTGLCNDHDAYPIERVPTEEYPARLSGLPLSRIVLSLGAPDRHGPGDNAGEYLLIYDFGMIMDPDLPFPVPCLVPVTLVEGLLTEIDVSVCTTTDVWPLALPFAEA